MLYGYCIWHEFSIVDDQLYMVWFANKPTREVLYHALANANSPVWIGVMEVRQEMDQPILSSPSIQIGRAHV